MKAINNIIVYITYFCQAFKQEFIRTYREKRVSQPTFKESFNDGFIKGYQKGQEIGWNLRSRRK